MRDGEQLAMLLVVLTIVGLAIYHRRWRSSGYSHGTAAFSTDSDLKAAKMFGSRGLILGRTAGGKVIRIVNYVHVLLVGSSGAGKGVSVILPNLLTYPFGCVVFDCKGDLHETCSAVRKKLGRIIRIAPFAGGADKLNPLALIRAGPRLIDEARAVAASLVVPKGTESEPHWDESATCVICAIIVFVLLYLPEDERNLNSVSEIIGNPALLDAATEKLIAFGGVPARLGNQLKGYQDKERFGVLSTCNRHLCFLQSELVAEALATSTFNPEEIHDATVFIQIPPELLEAQKGLLRCWISTLVRVMGRGSETKGEALFLLDEASALGNLPAIEEAMVRGRSAGVRILLAYQSAAQVEAAFREKKTLIYDNCSTQIYLGASSYETAERISKMLGTSTIAISSANESRSWQAGGQCEKGGVQVSTGRNFQEHGRELLRPEEILCMSSELLIAFVKDVPPILWRRIKWFADPLFGTAKKRWKMPPLLGWVLFAISIGFIVAWLRGWKP